MINHMIEYLDTFLYYCYVLYNYFMKELMMMMNNQNYSFQVGLVWFDFDIDN